MSDELVDIEPGDRCEQIRANHVVRVVAVVTVNRDLGEALVTALYGPLRGQRYFLPLSDLRPDR